MDHYSTCFVCRKSVDYFHENLRTMKTMHSKTPICAAIKLILNKESSSIHSLNKSSIVCYECVGKINEFDTAQNKMQQIQRELNRLHENANLICNASVSSQFNKHEVNVIDTVNNGNDQQENGQHHDVDDSDSDYSNYSLVSLDKTLQMPKCSVCEQSFESYSNLIDHRQYCQKLQLTNNAVTTEYEKKLTTSENMDGKEKHTCHICHKSYTSRQNLQIHLNSKSVHILRCKYCGIKFIDNESLTEHEMRHLNRPKLQCIECEMVVTSKGTLTKHMLIHTKEKLHQCDICGKEFIHATSFKMHIRSHMNDRRSECYLCKFRTLSISQLRVHMRKHTGEKPHQCEHCGKRFARPCNRNTHARLHFEPLQKPHKCTTCGAAFARIGKLTEHYQKVHGFQIQNVSTKLFKINPLPIK